MIAAIEQQKVLRRRSIFRAERARVPPGSSARQAQIRVVPKTALPALLRQVPKTELVLGAALLLAILLPLFFRFSLLPPARPSISLPGVQEGENVLWQYLIPDTGESGTGKAAQGLPIGSLRTTGYAIQQGDTISGISQKFSLNMDTLISFNSIHDARSLKVGTVLALPNADGLKYRVRRGDYLGAIAKRYRIALNLILDWNDLESSVIVPGQELFIPGARLSELELNRVFGKLFIYPTRGRLTSRFGDRNDPITGVRSFHNGIDLANSLGTPVIASMSGKVTMLGYNPNFGKYIILSHPEGFQTLYGHLGSFQVKKGLRVKQGDLIALMGNTGYSTGSHLHFSIFHRGEPVDPFRYLH